MCKFPKLLNKLAFLAIIFIMPAISFAENCGDANRDGVVNILDVVYIINYKYKSGPAPNILESADVNSDELVNILDIVYLINYKYKSGPEPQCPAFYKIPSTTIIIPYEETTVIQDYDDIIGTITLDESSVYAQSVSIGDIIAGRDDDVAPNGFLRKVLTITPQSGSIVLETEQATINEAFETLYVSETHALRPSDVVSYRVFGNSTFQNTRDDETFVVGLNCVFYDQDGDSETTDDQIRLDGEYAFTAALFAEIEINWLMLDKMEFGIETNEDANINLTANLQWEFDESVEFDLAEFHLGVIMAGPIPLVPTLTIEAHIHGDLTVTFETGITFHQELRYGFGYEFGEFYDINDGTKGFTYVPPQFTAEFNFEPGISLNASCLMFGVAGPYAAGKTGLHFQSILSADPCEIELTYDLEAILYAIAGIETNIKIFEFDYHTEFQLYTHPIGEWIYPLGGTGTIIIDPEPNDINAPWTLHGPCEYNASGAGDEILSILDPGDYTITWESVSGWTNPYSETQTLATDATVTFSGTYVEESTNTVTDIDGNVYQTVAIGSQMWMAENLKVTHYRNGDPIPNIIDNTAWESLNTGAYCSYDNDDNNVVTYGRLYNWYAIDDNRNIAPAGWHVATDAEWQTLVSYLGGTNVAGGKMKEIGTTHWRSPNVGATNESGFNALPGGLRNIYGTFSTITNYALFFTSSEGSSSGAWGLMLYYSYSKISDTSADKRGGVSVRCVKD